MPIHRRPTRTPIRSIPGAPFTTAHASDALWTPSARTHAVRSGQWLRLQRGVFDVADPLDRDRAALRTAIAASLTCSRGSLSHGAAALAFGLPVLDSAARACLTVQSGTALRDLAQVHLHRATLTDDDVVELAGIWVTSPARTVLDVAREHGFDAGVVVADAALHHGLVTPGDLRAALEQCSGWPGRRAALAVVEFADARIESPLESLSRIRLSRSDLPAMTPQVTFCSTSGHDIGRGDFYFPDHGVVGECDGLGKRTIPGVQEREARREVGYLDCGLIVVHWGWRDLYGIAWERVLTRLRNALAQGLPPGSPRRRWETVATSPIRPKPLQPRLPLR